MGSGYCHVCQKDVFTEREMDMGTIIFLLCCCGVVPGIICLIVGLSKPENICTVCHNVTSPSQIHTHTSNIPQPSINTPIKTEETSAKYIVKFCQACGEEVTEGQKFCSKCGAET